MMMSKVTILLQQDRAGQSTNDAKAMTQLKMTEFEQFQRMIELFNFQITYD
jgi:hypothetical protein